jgi:hypothetical protein
MSSQLEQAFEELQKLPQEQQDEIASLIFNNIRTKDKTKYLYNDYIKKLSERFEAELTNILVGHNFDYGYEFEVALCQILRIVLPEKYGICRGYVVDSDGNQAGDDIIIYEQVRFPTLGLRNKNDYSRKEFIPVEAVYCYIEAKHSINFSDNNEQNISRAISQAVKVKSLALNRKPISPNQISPYHILPSGRSPDNYPKIQNPPFCVVIARHVKNPTTESLSGESIMKKFSETVIPVPPDKAPDLIILGKDVAILPVLPIPPGSFLYESPFFLPNQSQLLPKVAPDIAFGIALASILSALDWIQLGTIHWNSVITNALGIPKRDKN